jgi:hypothetical protein
VTCAPILGGGRRTKEENEMENTKLVGSTADEWLWSSGRMRWRRVYAGRADQVRAARAFAEALFVGMPCVDIVALAVGELAANAVRHTRSGEGGDGWFGLEIVCENPVYVAVTDMGGHGIPTVLPEGYGGSYLGCTVLVCQRVEDGSGVWGDLGLCGDLLAGQGDRDVLERP